MCSFEQRIPHSQALSYPGGTSTPPKDNYLLLTVTNGGTNTEDLSVATKQNALLLGPDNAELIALLAQSLAPFINRADSYPLVEAQKQLKNELLKQDLTTTLQTLRAAMQKVQQVIPQ